MSVLDDDANGMLEYEEVVDVLEGNPLYFSIIYRQEEYWTRKRREIQEGDVREDR